jgi:hypothetical protein
MMTQRKMNPRAEHRLRETQRVNNSVGLKEKFPELKSLVLNLAYFDANGFTKSSELKCTVHVRHAKSVLYFLCPSGECVGGDFDLSGAVACAVTWRHTIAKGEIRCQGWRTRAKEEKVPCRNLLRYRLSLGYV